MGMAMLGRVLPAIERFRIRRRLRALQKEYYQAPQKNDTLILQYFRELQRARSLVTRGPSGPCLHLGCEDYHIEGWINVDIINSPAVDLQADLSQPLPFSSGSIDFIHSEDLLEHLERDAGHNLLAECFRVLRPGGVMRLLTPDLGRLVANIYLHPRARHLAWCGAYLGAQTPCEALNMHCRMGGEHRFVYDYPYLKDVLTGIGFRVHRVSWNRSRFPRLRYLDLRDFGLNLFLEAAKP
ncbi:MAG: methyltransferase domain-containing protein [Acidobacteria bacterium]|nr:methyltransferase domain-containing protein [Acidobacteriota bacterium]